MADLYSMFQTDKSLEADGIWYNFDKETGFRLARAGGSNMKFVKALEETTRPYRRQIENNTLDKETADSVLIEAFVGTVLLDWRGVYKPRKSEDEEKVEIKYSRENAVKLLTDMPDLFAELREEATRLSNFRVATIEEDAGN